MRRCGARTRARARARCDLGRIIWGERSNRAREGAIADWGIIGGWIVVESMVRGAIMLWVGLQMRSLCCRV